MKKTEDGNPFYIYKVLPFSGPKYSKNQEKYDNDNGTEDQVHLCAICGKPVKYPYEFQACVVQGGDWARTMDEIENKDESDAGWMGLFGIGPDCHRKNVLAKVPDKEDPESATEKVAE